jgi:hypothetical protein
MKSRVNVITNEDHKFGEIFQVEPYESIKTVCELQHQIFHPEKMVKIGIGYDYQMGNGNIISAEQIA